MHRGGIKRQARNPSISNQVQLTRFTNNFACVLRRLYTVNGKCDALSLNLGLILSGEVELELANGTKNVIRAGDSHVQHGTPHRWRTRKTRPSGLRLPLSMSAHRRSSSNFRKETSSRCTLALMSEIVIRVVGQESTK